MTLLDAAEKALRMAGQPLHSTEIIALAVRRNWIHPRGRTPDHSLQAALWTDIRDNGRQSRFKMVGDSPIKRKYALRDPE